MGPESKIMSNTTNTELGEILVKYKSGTINPDPKKWVVDPENDHQLALQAIEAYVAQRVITELQWADSLTNDLALRKNIADHIKFWTNNKGDEDA